MKYQETYNIIKIEKLNKEETKRGGLILSLIGRRKSLRVYLPTLNRCMATRECILGGFLSSGQEKNPEVLKSKSLPTTNYGWWHFLP